MLRVGVTIFAVRCGRFPVSVAQANPLGLCPDDALEKCGIGRLPREFDPVKLRWHSALPIANDRPPRLAVSTRTAEILMKCE